MSSSIIILGFYMLISFFYRNSAKTMIKDIPTNWDLYQKHYKIPSKFLRKMFGLKKQSIPKFLCLRLYISFVFGILAFVAAIILNALENSNMVFKTMAVLTSSFVIVDCFHFLFYQLYLKSIKKQISKDFSGPLRRSGFCIDKYC